jgi:hypothetical protein
MMIMVVSLLDEGDDDRGAGGGNPPRGTPLQRFENISGGP